MYRWIKAIIIWAFTNRGIGLKYIKQAIDVADWVASQTKNKVDDRAIQWVGQAFINGTKLLPEAERKSLAQALKKSNDKRVKDVKLTIRPGGKVVANIAGVEGVWDPSNGSVKLGITK